jgi:hypothetical protein
MRCFIRIFVVIKMITEQSFGWCSSVVYVCTVLYCLLAAFSVYFSVFGVDNLRFLFIWRLMGGGDIWERYNERRCCRVLFFKSCMFMYV